MNDFKEGWYYFWRACTLDRPSGYGFMLAFLVCYYVIQLLSLLLEEIF